MVLVDEHAQFSGVNSERRKGRTWKKLARTDGEGSSWLLCSCCTSSSVRQTVAMMQSAGSLTLGYIGRQASPSKFRVRNSGEIRVRNSTGKIRDRLRGGLGTRHAQERREGKPLPCPASIERVAHGDCSVVPSPQSWPKSSKLEGVNGLGSWERQFCDALALR